MHPPSSSVCVFQENVTIHQQKFIPNIIRHVHHVMFTSPTVSRLRHRSLFVARSLDRHAGFKVATQCLGVYAQTNVGLLCCVGSGSIIGIPLGWIGFVFDLKNCVTKGHKCNCNIPLLGISFIYI